MNDSTKLKLKSIVAEDWDLILIFLLLALALRLYFSLTFDVLPDYKELKSFVKLAQMGTYDKIYPPLHLFFLQIIFRIFGFENFKAVYIAQSFIGSLTVIPMYVVARKMGNRLAGGIAAAITAIYPNFLLYTISVLPDTMSILVIAMLMLMTVIQIDESLRVYIMASITGIGMLFRPIIWFCIPGMLISIKKRIAFLLIIIAILAPWAVYSSVQSRRFVPGYHPWSYRFDISKYHMGKDRWHTVDRIYTNASTMLQRTAIDSSWTKNQRQSAYAAEYAYILVMLLGFGGMIRYYRKEHRAIALPVLLYAAFMVLFSAVELKYRSLMEPLLILYTAVFAANLCRGFRPNKSAKTAP